MPIMDRGAARLLRVPLVPDGAVGRSRVDRVHRRPQDRRGARPQRPAPLALRRHQGRPRRDGVRGRACSTSRPSSVLRKGRLAAGPHLLRRPRAGPHRRGRGDQGAATSRSARTASGSSRTACCSASCRARGARAAPRRRSCASSSSRCSATRSRICASCSRRWRRQGKWPLGSMGEDAALACLSDRPRLLYHYFKQLFAQVTNPAMDSINERPVMSLYSTLGAEKNLLEETPEHARMLRVEHPVITRRGARAAARRSRCPGFRARTLPCLFKVARGGRGPARRARWRCAARRAQAVRERRQPPDPLGPRRLARPGADPDAARDRRRAPPPGARGAAHAVRPRLRDRRGARGRALRAADRLRRGRDQSLPRVPDARRAGRATGSYVPEGLDAGDGAARTS